MAKQYHEKGREIERLSTLLSEQELAPLSPSPTVTPPSASPGWTTGQKVGAGLGIAGLATAGIGAAGSYAWKKAHERIAAVLAQHGMQLNQLTILQRNLLRAIWSLSEWVGKRRVLRYYIQRYGVETIITTPQMWDVIAEIYYRRPVSDEDIQTVRSMVGA